MTPRLWSTMGERGDPEHYLALPGATIVDTDALKTTHDQLRDVIRARAMACIHGDAGLGKTLSATASLRALAPDNTLRIQFHQFPKPNHIRTELFQALRLSGVPPTDVVQFDALLCSRLSERFRVLVCDEAQMLSRTCFEYLRRLWDDLDTDIAIVFVGGGNCYEVLRREPMLASRVYTWQEYRPMDAEQVLETIPRFHPLWAEADPALIEFADEHAAQGNFRAWASLTRHCLDGMARLGSSAVDEKLLRWVFSRIAGRRP